MTRSFPDSVLALAFATFILSLAVHGQAQTLSKHTPGSLRQLAQLTAPDGGNGTFGYSIAMSGDTIVVGAPSGHNSTGAAYVYVKPVTGWADMIETAELTASDSYPGLNFGFSVAISGDTIVVGSYGHNAVYLFTKPQGGGRT